MKNFSFTTDDGITIYGVKNQPNRVTKRMLCLHMMPATKESYLPFMQAVEKLDWLVYAIDFRGHGESTEAGKLDYRTFDDKTHQQYSIDAHAAIKELEQDGKVNAIIGASIGANIALHLQADLDINKSVILSPGIGYRGIKTLPDAGELKPYQTCYIIASEEIRQSGEKIADEAREIFDTLSTSKKKIDIYSGQEHGTDIVMSYPDRLQKIIHFITTG